MIASAVGAVAVAVVLGAREWPPLIPWTAVAFVAAAVVARVRPPWACWAVLGTAFISPVIFQATRGEYFTAYQVVWVAAVLGMVTGGPRPLSWSLPSRWRTPLVYWALIVAVTWPIVVFREADFQWHMFDVYRASTTGIGGPPPVAAVFLATVALTHLAGILFVDHLCASFTLSDESSARRLRRDVLAPLVLSAMAAGVVAVYQGTVDLFWLSDHHWPHDGRAAGGLIDGDATGALLGFVVVLPWIWLSRRSVWRVALAAAASSVALVALWMTGSRSALIAALLSATLSFWSVVRVHASKRAVVLALLLAVGVASTGVAVLNRQSTGPVARIKTTLEDARHGNWQQFVEDQFFNRGAAVGSASVLMFKQHPITGVGLGSFYQLFPDYAFYLTGNRQGFDNAQSWYRHLLAEFGLLGSIGWIWFTVSFGLLLWRTRGAGEDAFRSGLIKAAIWSIAIVSHVAMPTQVTSIAILVWALFYAYVLHTDDARRQLIADAAPRRIMMPLTAVAVILFAAGTTLTAWRDLRPPYRAMFASWSYQRGMHPPESGPDGVYWWTEQEAVYTNDAKPGYLKLVFWVSHPDVASNPVHLTLWSRDREIAQMDLRDTARVERYVPVPDKAYSMMITSRVSRTWQPSSVPGGDQRHLGLGMADWVFVETPPPGAVVLR